MAKNFDPEIGKNTRWRRGQPSPNPGGRPRYRVVSAYLRQALETGDADRIGRSLLKLAKNGNMRAISEVLDRTEGKAPQTIEVAVEKSEGNSPDWRNMSRDELVEHVIDSSVNGIKIGLESRNDEHLEGEVRKAMPRLRELHQGLTNLIKTLDETDKSIAPAQDSVWRIVESFPGGGSVKVYVGP